MRFLIGLSILTLAACSGSSSSELFADEPRAAEPTPASASASAEPAPSPPAAAPSAPPAAPPAVKDAGAADVVVLTKDAAPLPTECSFDSECTIAGEVCNWRTDTCAAPGAIDDPCKRDLECSDGLCNWKLTVCSEPAPEGTPCKRHKECASGTCGSSFLCE